MSTAMRPIKVALVGDKFMRAASLSDALLKIDGFTFDFSSFETDWPDTPFGPPFDGVKEYQGSPEDVARVIGDAEICLTHLAPFTRAVFEACPNLKLIGVTRGGPVNIDRDAAREHGVQIVNAPGRNASAVAEFTIGFILCQTRLITAAHADLSNGIWRGDLFREDRTGSELSNLTVGLVGYSAVGRRVARLLHPFGCKVIFSDPYVDLTDEDRDRSVEKVTFEDLLETADVVSLHARLTPETRQMIGEAALSAMKPGCFLINTARGELIDQPALVAALKSGHVRGAAMDIFDTEPLDPNDPLTKLPNVTLTPHIAGASLEVITYAADVIAADVANYLHGRELNNTC